VCTRVLDVRGPHQRLVEAVNLLHVPYGKLDVALCLLTVWRSVLSVPVRHIIGPKSVPEGVRLKTGAVALILSAMGTEVDLSEASTGADGDGCGCAYTAVAMYLVPTK
jgi:hypothetical protein